MWQKVILGQNWDTVHLKCGSEHTVECFNLGLCDIVVGETSMEVIFAELPEVVLHFTGLFLELLFHEVLLYFCIIFGFVGINIYCLIILYSSTGLSLIAVS